MKNNSGIYPVGYRCLVLMPPKKEKDEKGFRKSESGIIIYKSEEEDRQENAVMVGTFIAGGGIAFTGDETSIAWPKDNIPKPGCKILFDKYAGGAFLTGIDGNDYKLINDREIGAIVEEEYGN